ncbi:MAG: DUF3343 domain-containing protein [Clostridia bacterium]|nr:DUF3343 domain-containing protein [Clostridia bacterium]
MKNPCTVDIGSVTHAMKAQRALTAAAIYTEVIKTDIGRHGKGCVYGLAFPCPQAERVRLILREAGFRPKNFSSPGDF